MAQVFLLLSFEQPNQKRVASTNKRHHTHLNGSLGLSGRFLVWLGLIGARRRSSGAASTPQRAAWPAEPRRGRESGGEG